MNTYEGMSKAQLNTHYSYLSVVLEKKSKYHNFFGFLGLAGFLVAGSGALSVLDHGLHLAESMQLLIGGTTAYLTYRRDEELKHIRESMAAIRAEINK